MKAIMSSFSVLRSSKVIRSIVTEATQGWCDGEEPGGSATLESPMIFSKDYLGYLARQTTKHLVAAKMIRTEKQAQVDERVANAIFEEMSLEDRINEEVRVILEAFQDDMLKTGASYPEMFKKVKGELARKYKAVL